MQAFDVLKHGTGYDFPLVTDDIHLDYKGAAFITGEIETFLCTSL